MSIVERLRQITSFNCACVDCEAIAKAAERIDILEAALREWPCPSCGGRKMYMNRSIATGSVLLPCKKCRGLGIHPKAAEALGLDVPTSASG